MIYHETKKISQAEIEAFQQAFREGESKRTYTITVQFHDKMEMDIKACSGQWSEAVLFDDGHELGCTDVSDSDSPLGEWSVDDGADIYIATIELED